MYSENFRKWLFTYLETGDIQNASGAQKQIRLQRLLDACNFCDNEANAVELKWICQHVEKFGLSQTRHIVAQSKNVTADLKESLSPAPVKKASTKSKVSPPNKSSSHESAFTQPAPYDYTVASSNTPQGLQGQVRDLLKAGGWHLAGGISVAVRHQPKVEVLFSQALFRY